MFDNHMVFLDTTCNMATNMSWQCRKGSAAKILRGGPDHLVKNLVDCHIVSRSLASLFHLRPYITDNHDEM